MIKQCGKKEKIIENVVEAFLGAIFLDCGYQIARKVARIWLNRILSELDDEDVEDYKSSLQELIQSDSRKPLKYELIKTINSYENNTLINNLYIGKYYIDLLMIRKLFLYYP